MLEHIYRTYSYKEIPLFNNHGIQNATYYGETKDGLPHGDGIVNYVDGKKWTCKMVRGKINGYGKINYTDGNYYEGNFVDGVPHGIGTSKITNNGLEEIYNGEFRDGVFHGNGVCETKTSIYEGEFKNGKPHGVGKIRSINGKYTYSGEWVDGKKNGDGNYHDTYDDYTGSFKDDKYHGFGNLTRRWSVYVGEFVDGLRHGNGKIIYNDKDGNIVRVFTGNWIRGKKSGEGTCINISDNKKYKQVWNDGVLIVNEKEREDCVHYVNYSSPPSPPSPERPLDERPEGVRLEGEDTGKCIICISHKADCAYIGCGHMVTCMECSKTLVSCSICRKESTRIKIFT